MSASQAHFDVPLRLRVQCVSIFTSIESVITVS